MFNILQQQSVYILVLLKFNQTDYKDNREK